MINTISILNLISFLFLLSSLLVILLSSSQKNYNKFLLGVSIAILIFVNITNILEHANFSKEIDQIEDFIEVLFFPFFIFAMLTSVLSNELNRRILSEKKTNIIFHRINSLIGLLDNQGRLIEVNQTALKLINKSPEEVIGLPFWETPWWTHSSEQQQKLKNAFYKACKGEVVNLEITLISTDNTLYNIDFSLTPIMNNKNEIEFLIPEGRDLTKIKEAEEKLRDYNTQLEILVKERTEELETTLEEYKSVNDELYYKNEQLGLINEEIKIKQRLIEKLLDEKEQKNKELYTANIDLENKKQQLETTVKNLKDTQAQLIHSEKMASLGILTAGIAHEINNPINFISSGITGLNMCISELIDAYNEFIDTILKTNDHELNQTINHIKEKYNIAYNLKGINAISEHITEGVNRSTDIIKSLRSYIHTGGNEFVDTDIHEIIETVLKMLHHEYKNRIEILKDYAQLPLLHCIPGKMNQLFMNLLTNAVQSIEEKGTIFITTWYNEKEMKIYCSIKDTGCGMSEEILKKIFDPFFTTKPVGKGTGLGLSISYNILKDHHGDIKINSQAGKGSEFIISLPLKPDLLLNN